MTGAVKHVGSTNTKWMGVIVGDDGKEYTFDEHHVHLDDSDRDFAVGECVAFQVVRNYPDQAFNVVTAS